MKPTSHVTKVDLALAPKLMNDLKSQGFHLTKPPYTLFSGKRKDVNVTFYASGKLMIQGKGTQEFIEFYLEPELLKSFDLTYKSLTVDTTARIGIDESGKGDFFGPLCIAGVYGTEESIRKMAEMGVKDSKKMNDITIGKLAQKIRKEIPHEVIRIGPAKYNELYAKFNNLNTLLAWGHSKAIEQLVGKTGCKKVIIDQFAAEHVVTNALKKKGLTLDLTQRHRGEEDVVVAAASILARDAFVQGIKRLEQEVELPLPKGAGSTVLIAGRRYIEKYGKEALGKVAKLHFKTTTQIGA